MIFTTCRTIRLKRTLFRLCHPTLVIEEFLQWFTLTFQNEHRHAGRNEWKFVLKSIQSYVEGLRLYFVFNQNIACSCTLNCQPRHTFEIRRSTLEYTFSVTFSLSVCWLWYWNVLWTMMHLLTQDLFPFSMSIIRWWWKKKSKRNNETSKYPNKKKWFPKYEANKWCSIWSVF